MPVGWRNVDVPWLNRLAIFRVRGIEGTGPGQDLGEPAHAVGRDMDDHKECGRQVARKPAYQRPEGLNATGRGADDDDIVLRHGPLPSDVLLRAVGGGALKREPDREGRPLAHGRSRRNRATVRGDDLLGDKQSEPHPTTGRSARAGLEEAGEDAR
jgi:hypothetical protein